MMANKKRTKKRLRRWFRITLIIIAFLMVAWLLSLALEKALNDWERWGRWCDYEKGRTCSIKEVEDYARSL